MEQIKKRSGLLLLGINTVFFCLMAWLLPIMFEDNDDTTMVWIANGIYSGTPDCHLVFINAILGQFLVWLYSFLPNVEWYVIVFSLFHVISMTIISDYFIKNLKSKLIKISVLILMYSLWAWIIVRFQFTTTAAITAFAGVLLLLQKRFVSGGIMLVLGALVRFSAAGLVGLVMAPAFVYEYKKEWIRSWIPLIVVLVCVFLVNKADMLFYQTDGWKEYVAYNSARGKINDNPNCWHVYGDLPEGVDQLDYSFVAGFFADPQIISTEDLNEIVKKITHPSLKICAYNAIYKVLFRYVWWFVAFGIIVLLTLIFCDNKKDKMYFALSYCLWVGILCYIGFAGSVKNRVFISSMLPMIYYAAIITDKNVMNGRFVKMTPYVVLFALSVVGFIIPTIQRSIGLGQKQQIMNEQFCLLDKAADFQIVDNSADLSVQFFPPFQLHEIIRPKQFINSYCMMKSPLNSTFTSHKDLVDGNILLFSRKPCDTSEQIMVIEKNYGIKADTIHFAETEHYVLLRFVSDKNFE